MSEVTCAAAHAHGVGVDHLTAHEDRDAGGAGADVDAGGAELLLVLHQARERREA